ncbi:MAG: hypothetical protein RSB71_01980 [Bacilli bacterium]
MVLKKLAYLKVKVKNENDEFCELYTFLEPTILYLPYDLIIKIEVIEKNKICLIVTSLGENKKIILSLNCPSDKVVIKNSCGEVILCLKLCAINILKPCYKKCNDICENDQEDCDCF